MWVNGALIKSSVAGLGLTEAEAIHILSTGQGTTAELAAANAAYYGPGGYYSQEPSVIAARSGVTTGDNPPEFPTPQLYVMETCGPLDGSCIQRNALREQANMALTRNASIAYNKSICDRDYAINRQRGGSSTAYNCGQYELQPVPAAPGATAPAVMTGGEIYAPIAGSPSIQTQQSGSRVEYLTTLANQPIQQITTQGSQLTVTHPVQTVPASGNAGNASAAAVSGASSVVGVLDEIDWKRWGLIGALGLAALWLMRKGA